MPIRNQPHTHSRLLCKTRNALRKLEVLTYSIRRHIGVVNHRVSSGTRSQSHLHGRSAGFVVDAVCLNARLRMHHVGAGLVEDEVCRRLPSNNLHSVRALTRTINARWPDRSWATHKSTTQVRGHTSTSYQALAWFWCSVTSLRTSRALENVGIRWTSWTRGRTCDTVRDEKASPWWLLRR